MPRILQLTSGSASVWSTINKDTAILSNGNLTATAASAFSAGRCDTQITTAKTYVEVGIIGETTNNTALGIVNGSWSPAGGNNVYSDANGVAFLGGGGIWTNVNVFFGPFANIGGFGLGPATVSLAFNPISGLFWYNTNVGSGWNGDVIANQNPATGVGGFGINSGTGGSVCALGTGPYFLAYDVNFDGTNHGSITLFPGPTFAFIPPAGFSGLP